MGEHDNRETVERLWQAIDALDFDTAGSFVDEDVVVEWPQSRERIRGRANFVAVNRNYPGQWAAKIRRLVVDGDAAASEVSLSFAGQTVTAVSFYEFHGGKSLKETDWWPEPYPAPTWRARWVEPMTSAADTGDAGSEGDG